MNKVQHVNSATQKKCNMKEWNMKKLGHGNNTT